MRDAYPSKVIYNYTAHKVYKSGRLSFHKNTISALINKFIELGWCYRQTARKGRKNVIFSANWRLAGKYSNQDWFIKTKIKGSTYKQIQCELEAFIIKEQLKKQQFNSSFRQSQIYPKQRGRNIKISPMFYKVSETATTELHLSLKTIAQLFNKSIQYASQVVNKLLRRKLLLGTKSKTTLIRKMSKVEWNYYKLTKKVGEFFYKGFLFVQLPIKYRLSKRDLIDFKLTPPNNYQGFIVDKIN